MTKQQKNKAFVKMLKEFPRVFGRVSFRERLMLRAVFDYVVEEIIVDLEKELTVEKDQHQEEVELHLHAEEYIKSLEKENAELKHTIATLRQEKDNVSMHAKAMEVVAKTRSDQLTNAKEIIEQLLLLPYLLPYANNEEVCGDVTSYLYEAEQFLKEIEK